MPDASQAQELKMTPQAPGLLIPGCTLVTTLQPYIEDCSLLQQYPDLQVADPALISYNPLGASVNQHHLHFQHTASEVPLQQEAKQEPQCDRVLSIPDQGYLVMGASENISLDLPGSGLEPMSNSLLNGILEKQLEEVYMQHLTENLARCNSHLGNSLLHGLVPPPQPHSQSQGPCSLEAGLEDNSRGDSSNEINYMSTHNLVPCSSNFSSPVLRISESYNHLQGNVHPKY